MAKTQPVRRKPKNDDSFRLESELREKLTILIERFEQGLGPGDPDWLTFYFTACRGAGVAKTLSIPARTTLKRAIDAMLSRAQQTDDPVIVETLVYPCELYLAQVPDDEDRAYFVESVKTARARAYGLEG